MNYIAANIEVVQQRIKAAAQRTGREADNIILVAVTKTYLPEMVITAYQAGLSHFGENLVQEGQEKVAAVADWLASRPENKRDEPPTWHLIGHLQRQQVGQALESFNIIHSVDSLRLAERINRLAEREGQPPIEILLQCNVSGETTKSGFALNHWTTDKTKLSSLLETVASIANLNKIKIRGLMTIAPLCSNPEEVRPIFCSLAALREKLQGEMPELDWGHLSMGMTDDFEIAIEEGATMVRIGRAIFGERN